MPWTVNSELKKLVEQVLRCECMDDFVDFVEESAEDWDVVLFTETNRNLTRTVITRNMAR